jgi:cyclophilin family peptidyl-prolyl cis-trans isomerase
MCLLEVAFLRGEKMRYLTILLILFASVGFVIAGCGPSKPDNPVIVLETTMGEIEIELFQDVAPRTVEHILGLVNEGFYDSLVFHRVVDEFVIQTGDPTTVGRDRPEFTIPGEPNDSTHKKGRVGIALRGSDINSGSTQFYICVGETNRLKHLDGYQFTVFGEVVSGMETAVAISDVATSGTPQRIISDTTWRKELLRLAAVDSADVHVVQDSVPMPERPLQPVRIIDAYQK